jgi:hypothetical protein
MVGRFQNRYVGTECIKPSDKPKRESLIKEVKEFSKSVANGLCQRIEPFQGY